jgi:hypothetical protein
MEKGRGRVLEPVIASRCKVTATILNNGFEASTIYLGWATERRGIL